MFGGERYEFYPTLNADISNKNFQSNILLVESIINKNYKFPIFQLEWNKELGALNDMYADRFLAEYEPILLLSVNNEEIYCSIMKTGFFAIFSFKLPNCLYFRTACMNNPIKKKVV